MGSSTGAPGCRVGPGCVGMAGAILPSILPSIPPSFPSLLPPSIHPSILPSFTPSSRPSPHPTLPSLRPASSPPGPFQTISPIQRVFLHTRLIRGIKEQSNLINYLPQSFFQSSHRAGAKSLSPHFPPGPTDPCIHRVHTEQGTPWRHHTPLSHPTSHETHPLLLFWQGFCRSEA